MASFRRSRVKLLLFLLVAAMLWLTKGIKDKTENGKVPENGLAWRNPLTVGQKEAIERVK